jgi:uncharacterized membrane protein YcgQ (UPF0703/DUF1980 family)
MSRRLLVQIVALGYIILVAAYSGENLSILLHPIHHALVYVSLVPLLILVFCQPRGTSATVAPRVVLILLFPLVMAIAVPLRPFDATRVQAGDITIGESSRRLSASTYGVRRRLEISREGDLHVLPLGETRKLLERPEPEFEGTRIRTEGWFLTRPGRAPVLFRFVIFCCAADAQPEGFELGGHLPVAPDRSWVRVEGRIGPADRGRRPFLVDTWTVIPAPGDPGEFR